MMQWMLYAIGVASVISVAAWAWNRSVSSTRLPSRWAWLFAMILSVAIPLGHTLTPLTPAERFVLEVVRSASISDLDPTTSQTGISDWAIPRVGTQSIDRWLRIGWVCTSMAAASIFALGLFVIRREHRRGSITTLCGREIVITQTLGPAVVGLMKPTILLPAWVRQFPVRQRRWIVVHELQHIRAKDEWLIGAGICLLIVFPWNAALWWQFRRLRLSIELDCDQRVLRSSVNPREYGQVLLDVATRQPRNIAPAAALIESRSSLEVRIETMCHPSHARSRTKTAALALASFAACATAAAWNPPTDRPWTAGFRVAQVDKTPRVPSPQVEYREQWKSLTTIIEHFEPGALTEDRSKTPLIFIAVNEQGRVVSHYSEMRPSWQVGEISENQLRTLYNETLNQSTSSTPMFVQLRTPAGADGLNPGIVLLGVNPTAKSIAENSPRLDLAAIRRDRTWLEAHLINKTRNERAIIELADPAALEGLNKGMELWIALTEEGTFIQGGQRKIIKDPHASQRFVEELLPASRVTEVARGTAVRDAKGNRIAVTWHWLQR